MKPRFDPTINLGHVISLGGVIVVVAGSLYLTDYRLNALEKNVESSPPSSSRQHARTNG